MNATATESGNRWEVIDGKDKVICWIDANGFHCRRISDWQGKARNHAPQRLSYEKLILGAEKQMSLL